MRGRPAEVLGDVALATPLRSANGYLSGHAAVAVALATALHPYLGKVGRWFAWGAAVLVCAARVYVGAHLPLDVVGGAALGWLLGSIASIFVLPRRSSAA